MKSSLVPPMGAQEREVTYAHQEQPIPSKSRVRQIEETLEQKPDRDVVEKWLSKVMFKLGEIHEDVRSARA